jgi:hypothetical protein
VTGATIHPAIILTRILTAILATVLPRDKTILWAPILSAVLLGEREVMQDGSLPPKPYWPICHRTKRLISSAATRRASISRAGDGHVEDDRLPPCGSLLARACGQTTDNVALEENSDDHERSDRRS